MSEHTTQNLANEFCRVLATYLTPDELEAVRAKNAVETHPDVCHTHDYCDANMAMQEALEKGLCWPMTDDSTPLTFEADCQLWNGAWAKAVAQNFHPTRKTVLRIELEHDGSPAAIILAMDMAEWMDEKIWDMLHDTGQLTVKGLDPEDMGEDHDEVETYLQGLPISGSIREEI